MRILGGKCKGRKLISVKGENVRPAMALSRKSIFDTLQEVINNISVLDLYAGTGILGIEALSRGANNLTLIDFDKISIKTIYKNLEICNLKGKVIFGKLPNILERVHFKNKAFDLIFIDPPYGSSKGIEDSLKIIVKNNIIQKNGIISIESEAKSDFEIPETLKLYKEKKLGNTKLTILNAI